MGLLSRIKHPVEGTAQVTSCAGEDPTASYGTATLQLVVQAPGVVPFSVEEKVDVPVGKWPMAGSLLAVTFDRDHTDRLKIDWEKAAAPVTATPVAPGSPTVAVSADATRTVTNIDITKVARGSVFQISAGGPGQTLGLDSVQYRDAIERAERFTGMDLDGDGKVAGGPPPAPGTQTNLAALMQQAMSAAQQAGFDVSHVQMPSVGGLPAAGVPAPGAPSVDDSIGKLEELVALKDRGVLTDDEFAAQKKKILGET